ncbi:dihydroorotate dehydrogenase electron transfer subunit [candidate division KSB1 bacterium]|nr:dihydroorotate dehydrogenase electron transfer subunit [candidate division KSB1 bacterium]RQW06027.1 MAG: dihydroorotate dehydrogenase electron transfer subunit [candidate division KSB1 bacterium]
MTLKRLCRSTLENISHVARNTYVLTFRSHFLSHGVSAGQFLEIKVPQCSDILWRRPFSIHNIDPENDLVHVLFHAIGRGTTVLSMLEIGEGVEILGPLGNHFHYDEHLEEAIVVAGGLGIAPFMLMKRELRQRDIKMQLFYGVNSSDHFCALDQFADYATLHLSTDDGSRGYHGVVTDMLIPYLENLSENASKSLFVCGPTPMLRTVQTIAQQYNIAAQVSVETIMACGFGACVGCAVPMKHPVPGKKEYYLACKDGPVFHMHEIVFDD